MNVGFSDGRNILGCKGLVCKKCLIWVIEEIHDDEKRILSKSNHKCDPQNLHVAQSVTDIPGTILKRRQELIFWLSRFCVNNIYDPQELVEELTAVEIPPSVFDKQSDIYEEYVDLDSLSFCIPDWAYRAPDSLFRFIVNPIANDQGLIDVAAVEVPASIFDS